MKWDREAKAAGERHRVFCASMADVFEDWDGRIQDHNGRHLWISDRGTRGWEFDDGSAGFAFEKRPATMQHVRRRLFALIDATPNLDWLLLTKRPENIAAMMPHDWVGVVDKVGIGYTKYAHHPPRNVWIGTTVENQQAADERIPHLLRVPARVRFLSCEPLLGPVDLSPWLLQSQCQRCLKMYQDKGDYEDCPSCGESIAVRWPRTEIGWVIAGGESGPHARPSHPDWFRSLRDQCQQAGVPYFHKQNGEWLVATDDVLVKNGKRWDADADHCCWLDIDGQMKRGSNEGISQQGYAMVRVGKAAAGRLLDGREWNEVPK